MPRFAAERLTGYAMAALRPFGVGDGDARVVAESVVDADLEGHATQGIAQLPALLAGLRDGAIDPRSRARVAGGRQAVAVLDAGAGFGQLAGVRAADLAIERAAQVGLGLVAVRCRHRPGPMGFSLRRIAARGLVGLAFSSAAAPPASGSSLIGVAMPVGTRPVVLDVAMSRLGGGHVLKATAPLDAAALSPEGHGGAATAIAPPAPHAPVWTGADRTSMLALLVGMLAGVDPAAGDGAAGHAFVAVDAAAVPGFDERVRRMSDVGLPERRERERDRRLTEGVDIPDDVVAALVEATGTPL